MKQTKYRKMALSDLRPAEYNPRAITDEAFQGLQNSIERFGLVQPIIWNEATGNVVGGHQRLAALIEAGETHCQVAIVNLPIEEEKALNLALNNPAIEGQFTEDVRLILAELQEIIPEAVTDLCLAGLASLEFEGLEEGELREAAGGAINYSSQFAVAVICEDEEHQQRVYDRLAKLKLGELKVLVI